MNQNEPAKLAATSPLITAGIDDPRGITLEAKGNILISDGGASHQVKVFTLDGKFVRAIGKPGAPKAGPYDPLHMNHPAGLAVDPNGRVWVAENDFLPKRVSVWNADGSLWKAFCGPAKYGGGGTLEALGKTRFFYPGEGRGSMEFKLDWDAGTSQLVRVLSRPQPGDLKLPKRSAKYEFSIPLAALGLKPQAGQSLRGDVGILRGDGSETTARVYWSNKASGITADVPSEAMLTPQLWGRVDLKAAQ